METQITTAERFPLDYDELEKGSIISVEVIEGFAGAPRGTDAYRIGLLRMKGLIENAMLTIHEEVVCVKEDRGMLRILTDAETANYMPKRRESLIGGMCRVLNVQKHVDVSRLEAEQVVTHDRQLEVTGRIVQAIRTERKQIRSEAYQRTTPGLLEGEEVKEAIKYKPSEPSKLTSMAHNADAA